MDTELTAQESRLDIKLQAIKDKNLDEIIKKKTHIPSLGNSYTKEELQAWLDKRIVFLQKIKDSEMVSLESDKDVIYSAFSKEDKLLVKRILEEENFEVSSEEEWEKFVLIRLYKFLKEV